MNGPTLDEQVALVAAAYDAGWVDRAAAMDALIDATGMSPGLCARLLADQIVDWRRERLVRRLAARKARRDIAEQARAAEQNRRDDGSWT